MGTTATAHGVADSVTVQGFLADWLVHMRGRVRRRTLEGYSGLIRLYVPVSLGAVALCELTPLQLQRLYGELLAGGRDGESPLSGGTVRNLHLVLTQAFGQAVRWGLLAANPAAGAQPPRPRRPERVVVDAALAHRLLAETEGTMYELPCALALSTGMRRSEILALRWSDISGDFSQLRVLRSLQPTRLGLLFEEPKTHRSRRSILLPTFLGDYLTRQQELQQLRRESLGQGWHEHGLVVTRDDGTPVNPDTLSTGWARFLRINNLPRVRFHDLRHAHATLLLLQGVHPKIVSERLGHASVGITLDTYSHVLPSMQSQAAEAFDGLFPQTSSTSVHPAA
jgi:integrase